MKSDPFVHDVEIVCVARGKQYISICALLPDGGYLQKPIGVKNQVWWMEKIARELLRDLAFSVFGEDWKYFENSMEEQDRMRLGAVLKQKIAHAIA